MIVGEMFQNPNTAGYLNLPRCHLKLRRELLYFFTLLATTLGSQLALLFGRTLWLNGVLSGDKIDETEFKFGSGFCGVSEGKILRITGVSGIVSSLDNVEKVSSCTGLSRIRSKFSSFQDERRDLGSELKSEVLTFGDVLNNNFVFRRSAIGRRGRFWWNQS